MSDMEMWLYSLGECVLCLSVIVVNVRMCMGATSWSGVWVAPSGSVSACLKRCLGWVGALGGAVGVPVSVLLNLRSPRCLYTCITLVCCPLLVRQFTMCLLLLLSLDVHLQHRMADRYQSIVTRRRALCSVLLCWVVSVLVSFAQFIGWDVLDTWRVAEEGGSAGLGLDGGNWTFPSHPPPPKYPQDRFEIGKYLPYGGFLSKFYVEDRHNFTYAEIHSSHWGVCAPDTVLRPQYQVYVYGVTVFLLPLLVLLGLYLDILCARPTQSLAWPSESPKRHSRQARSLALSLCLLVFLCLPLYITHSLSLLTPDTLPPSWAHPLAAILFQGYSLVPPLLFTPSQTQVEGELAPLPQANAPFRGKAEDVAQREAVHGATWCHPRCFSMEKVCPDV